MKGAISQLMLERYRLGEVSVKEQKLVEAAISRDPEIRSRYESLGRSDRELRPLCMSHNGMRRTGHTGNIRWSRFHTGKLVGGICAAAVLLCVFFPSMHYLKGRSSGGNEIFGMEETGRDRIKGTEARYELSLYLKEKPELAAADGGRKLSDRTLLGEGSTVQLAYTTPPEPECYGVIFSIDGRSEVVLHYPYSQDQSAALLTGKRTFLTEAYTLDDAPDFEIFFMVASQEPLDIETILQTAGELAKEPKTALVKSAAAFTGCEVETISIRKQGGKK